MRPEKTDVDTVPGKTKEKTDIDGQTVPGQMDTVPGKTKGKWRGGEWIKWTGMDGQTVPGKDQRED